MGKCASSRWYSGYKVCPSNPPQDLIDWGTLAWAISLPVGLVSDNYHFFFVGTDTILIQMTFLNQQFIVQLTDQGSVGTQSLCFLEQITT
jgi:hypothetical protein